MLETQVVDPAVNAAEPRLRHLSVASVLRAHWGLFAILTGFVASALIVPTLANVTISDDWVYSRSVRILLQQHRLEVHPLVSPNLVFQVGWAALFGLVFGDSLGVMRL